MSWTICCVCTLSSPRMFPLVDLTDLRERQDQERSSSTGFNDDRQELWVDCTEGAVPCHLRNTNVIIRLLSLHHLAKDVAKLTLPHDAATHGCSKQRKVGGGKDEVRKR